MRHPLWLVDTTFLALFVIAGALAFFSVQKLPKRIKLDVGTATNTSSKVSKAVDPAQVYENDLFNTYHKVIPEPVQPDYTSPMPTPPTQTTVKVPPGPQQPFLPPLEIKLKGIITVDDESNNIAIIADSKTSEQKNYRPGDTVEDARLIRVLHNRVIFIRSNGQQETLYLNAKDLENDPAFVEERAHWIHVVKKIHDELFLLDPETFVQIARNIAQFIDMLDLTTVYQKGKSIGCRVGAITHDSLGSAMGLEPYDIITTIDNVATANTEQRYKVYTNLTKKTFGDSVKVSVTRDGQPIAISYKLHDLKDPLDETLEELQKSDALAGIHTGPTAEEVEEERIELLKQKYKFAPTLQDMKINQKMSMLKKGKRERVKDFSLAN